MVKSGRGRQPVLSLGLDMLMHTSAHTCIHIHEHVYEHAPHTHKW